MLHVCNNQQEEEPKGSFKSQQYHACLYDTCSKVISSLIGYFWSSGAESSVELQELAVTRVKPATAAPVQVKKESTSTGRRRSIWEQEAAETCGSTLLPL